MPNLTSVRVLALLAPLLLTQACLTESKSGGGGGGGGGEPAGGGTPQPVDHTAATGTATSNLRENVEDFEAAFDFVEASQLIEQLLDLFPVEEPDDEAEPWPDERPMPPGDDDGQEPPPPDDGQGGGEVVEEELDIDFGEALDEVLEAIEERLLVEEQVEEDAEHSVTYLLDPERVCQEDEGADSPPRRDDDVGPDGQEEDPEGDDECRRVLAEVPLRVRVTSFAEGDVDLTLLVGEDRHEPVRVELHADRLAAQVDLAAGKAALELLVDAAAEDDEDQPDLPDAMAGVVRAELLKNAPKDYTASLSILQPVSVEDGGDEAVTVSLGVAKPLASFRLDGNAQTATAALNVGTVDVSLPYQWFVDGFYGDDVACAGEGNGEAPMPPRDGEPGDPPEHWEEDCEGEGEDPPEVDGSLRISDTRLKNMERVQRVLEEGSGWTLDRSDRSAGGLMSPSMLLEGGIEVADTGLYEEEEGQAP